MLEFPAGGADGQESPLEAARRELAEETGICVVDLDRFQPLPSLAVLPDRMPACPYLFRVDLTPEEWASRGAFDEEIQEVCRLTQEEALATATDGRILACLPLAMIFRHLCLSLSFPGKHL
jgi:8-oxo-dGTP pyrophosphatase MutT (NUDIX family)